MKKGLNPNRSKIHRSYTVNEVSELYGVHKRTVRNWIKIGLPTIDDVHPMLILGTDLKIFIRQQKMKNRTKCHLSDFYCLKCRARQKAEPKSVRFIAEVSGVGRVFALCSSCGTKVNKYFSWRRLEELRRDIDREIPVSTKTHSYEG